MARPRKYKVGIAGLSCYTDLRTKKVYWRYKHPVTGTFHGLGTNESAAKEIATEANKRLTENQMANLFRAREAIARSSGKAITTQAWVESYSDILIKKVEAGEIKAATASGRDPALNALISQCGIRPLDEVSTRDIATIIDEYTARGVPRMAQLVRSVLIDVFREAQHAGEVPPGYNPAQATKNPRARVNRQRLSLAEWREIYVQAEKMQPWVSRSMLLALITGQRVGDIAAMKFSDIWDDALHIVQEKTGARIAIPLSLHCDALGLSLRETIKLCRDPVISQWILHQRASQGAGRTGEKLKKKTLTITFARARDKSGLTWSSGTPPSFHEQRSLSERLYREQGIDTRSLLGHKSQSMTDRYNDDRGKEWKVVSL